MKSKHTHITILLDRSGSMASTKDDVIGGFRRFLEDQQRVEGTATITLQQFDDQFETVMNAVDIQQAKPLTDKTFVPRGSTALLAAIGRSVDETGEMLKNRPDPEKPEKVIFVIITDGQENHSNYVEWGKDRTKAAISDKIKHQTDIYKWQFVFIGANQDAIAEAGDIGISGANAMKYADNAVGTQSLYCSMSSNVRSFRVGSKKDMSWEADQRDDQKKAGA